MLGPPGQIPQVGRLKQQGLLLTVLGSRCWQGRCRSEACPVGLTWLTWPLFVFAWRKGALHASHRALIPLRTSSSPEDPPPNTITMGLRTSNYEFWGDTFSPSHRGGLSDFKFMGKQEKDRGVASV